VLIAVNHSGDSDSTGVITGNILGCLNGKSAIPSKWLDQLELKDIIETLGMDLFIKYRSDDLWSNKYPGY
jgi:ADP-ribosylglycohydrolase